MRPIASADRSQEERLNQNSHHWTAFAVLLTLVLLTGLAGLIPTLPYTEVAAATATPTNTRPPQPTPTNTVPPQPTPTNTPPPPPTATVTPTPLPPTATPTPPPPTATSTRTATPPATATRTFTPAPTNTPVPACEGDEALNFEPAQPIIGETLIVRVTSARDHQNVSLEGTGSPQFLDAAMGGLGYVWRWRVSPVPAGNLQYTFYVNNKAAACVVGGVTAIAPTATPLPGQPTPPPPPPPPPPTPTKPAPTVTPVKPTNTPIPGAPPSPTPPATPTRTYTPVRSTPIPTPTSSPLPPAGPSFSFAGSDFLKIFLYLWLGGGILILIGVVIWIAGLLRQR